MPEDELKLPNIPIKIVRLGKKLKFTAGDYTLELKEIDDNDMSQTYPLLVLDKFITEATSMILKKEIAKQEKRESIRQSLLNGGVKPTDFAVDNVIRQIHEDNFGGQ